MLKMENQNIEKKLSNKKSKLNNLADIIINYLETTQDEEA